MADLMEKTHEKHYEVYRKNKLADMGFADTDSESQPLRYVGTRGISFMANQRVCLHFRF